MVSKVRDFLMDEGFIEYVLGVSPELVSQWEAYFRVHPEDIRDAEEASISSARRCLRLFNE